MINEEEKFDDLLRTKLSERDFFFDELNWQNASSLIEHDENRKKRRRFVIIFLGGLAAGITLTIPVMNVLNNKPGKASYIKGSTTTNPQPVTIERQANATPNEPGQNIVTKHSASIATMNNGNEKSTKNNTAAGAVSLPTTIGKKPKVINAPSKKVPHAEANALLAFNNTQSTYSPIKKTPYHQQGNTATTKIASAAGDKINNRQQRADTAETITQAGKEAVKENAPVIANSNTPEAKTDSQNTASIKEPRPSQVTTKPTDSSKNKNVTASIDTSTIPITYPKKTSDILSLDAGGGYSFGWQNKGTKEANGLSPLLGIRYTHLFNKKLALSAGVQYNSLTRLKTGYSNSVTSYDFGYNNIDTTVTPNTIYYLAFPVILRYYIDDNNAICAGASLSYLTNTRSTVTTSSQNDLNPETNQSKNVYGYTGGFHTTDIQTIIAYRRRLYKSFSISIEGYYGLTDIEINSYYSDNSFQRNSGFRLILSFDILK